MPTEPKRKRLTRMMRPRTNGSSDFRERMRSRGGFRAILGPLYRFLGIGGDRLPFSNGRKRRQIDSTHAAVQASSVRSCRDALTDIGRELDRARRYERPMSLLLLTLHYRQDGGGTSSARDDNAEPHEATPDRWTAPSPGEEDARVVAHSGDHGNEEMGERVPDPIALLNAWVIGERLREIDILAYDPIGQRFVLVAPESDREAADGAVQRISALMKERGFLVRAGVAQFPGCGLTIPQLVETGEERLSAELGAGVPGNQNASERAG